MEKQTREAISVSHEHQRDDGCVSTTENIFRWKMENGTYPSLGIFSDYQ